MTPLCGASPPATSRRLAPDSAQPCDIPSCPLFSDVPEALLSPGCCFGDLDVQTWSDADCKIQDSSCINGCHFLE